MRPSRGNVGWVTALLSLFLVASSMVWTTPAIAAANTCRARNVTKGTPGTSDLQAAIKGASAGDVIEVKYVCVGNFRIGKKLTLVGKPTTGVAMPVLHANGSGRVLLVNGVKVKLDNLKITGGDNPGLEDAGGVLIKAGTIDAGSLVLVDSIVRGNAGTSAGGIVVGTQAGAGHLVMKGSSRVVHNAGTGISVGMNSSVTMNDQTLVASNAGDGIHTYYGDVEMYDDASVEENDSVGISNQFGHVTLNGSSSVTGNYFGISNGWGFVTLNDFSSVSGNQPYGGIGIYGDGGLSMNDSSSVAANLSNAAGGGIRVDFGSVYITGEATVTGNTTDADDSGGETGGGIYVTCNGSVDGATDGGNVDGNYRGTALPQEDNVAYQSC